MNPLFLSEPACNHSTGCSAVRVVQVTEGNAVWRNRSDARLTCRPLPSASGGVIERFRWSLGAPNHDGEAIAAEYPRMERGCFYAQGLRLCAFEFLSTRRA
jgi:hypothetical protein